MRPFGGRIRSEKGLREKGGGCYKQVSWLTGNFPMNVEGKRAYSSLIFHRYLNGRYLTINELNRLMPLVRLKGKLCCLSKRSDIGCKFRPRKWSIGCRKERGLDGLLNRIYSLDSSFNTNALSLCINLLPYFKQSCLVDQSICTVKQTAYKGEPYAQIQPVFSERVIHPGRLPQFNYPRSAFEIVPAG